MSKDKTQVLLNNPEVYEETLNEFSSKSYDLASVNEIIKKSKYNKGSFYYRFKDKFELYISLLDYVFVQQIDLYQKTGFSLITNDDSKSILNSMFNNLIQLYNLDKRFYHLFLLFLHEEDSHREQSLQASVGSLYERYLSKLTKLGYFTDSQMIVIESVYKNFPINKILNGQLAIKDLIGSLIGTESDHVIVQEDSNIKKEIESHLKDPINFLLIDDIKYQLNGDYFNIFDFSRDSKMMIKKLKRKALSFRFDIRKILSKYMNKPIFNHMAIKKLLKSGLSTIEDDQMLMDILYALVYGILDLQEFIVLNRIVHKLDDYQIDYLINLILPINGQLSKIIITERQLTYAIDYPFNNIYYYDDVSGMKKYHVNDLKELYGYKLYCEYLEEEDHYKAYFDNLDELIDLKENKTVKILSIKLLNKLSLNDLRGDVS